MYLSQCKMTLLARNLLGTEPQLIPADNALHGHSRTGDGRRFTTNLGALCDQGANIYCCRWDMSPSLLKSLQTNHNLSS